MFVDVDIGQVATCLDSVTIQLCEKEAELVGLRGRVGVDLDCVHDDVRGRVGHLDHLDDDDDDDGGAP